VLDLSASIQDNILILPGIPLPNFLAAYKAAHNLQGIPTPTIDFNFQDELDQNNGTTPLGAETAPPGAPPTPGAPFAPRDFALVVVIGNNHSGSQDDIEEEQEMINATNAIETAAIGGRAAVSHLIYDAVFKGTIKLIRKFHLQRKENKETKKIKATFTLPCLNKAAQSVATIIMNEPPAQMPVLQGLVNEIVNKATSAMEHRIKSLEDQLKATMGKTPNGAKKIQGQQEDITSGDPEEEGHPRRPQENYCPPCSP
jgi:hypothetical protein